MPPTPQIDHYRRFLHEQRGLVFDDYASLWGWSVTELDAFWRSIWDHFDLRSETPFEAALCEERMPGAVWFRGATLNIAAQALRHVDAAEAAGHPAIVHANEAMLARGELGEMRWPELQRQVGALAASMHDLGVRRGDRVAAYLPNVPATAVAFLAVASLGAVWSVCSPDMGPVAVLDRFRQIEPKLLIAADGVRYAGQDIDRMAMLGQLLDELPTVTDVVLLGNLDPQADPSTLARPAAVDAVTGTGAGSSASAAGTARTKRGAHRWDTLIANPRSHAPEAVPFDHPLWIVYSSGTTGLPKPIVHGHGGVLLEMLKGSIHNNVGATAETGDRFHWYSSTGWIMWNCQVGALMGGTTICLFDGSPAGPKDAPDWSTLWRFVALSGATFFGAGAAFYASCLKAGVEPLKHGDLSRLRAVGSTGSPLADESYDWIWANCPTPEGRPIWICIISGGTDFAGAFLTGLITEPLVRGQMQVRSLGAAVHAFSEVDADGQGRALIDEVGELVCTRPMPSMPLYFWGDDGNERYLSSYFDMYRGPSGEGLWRHGDWLRVTPSGGGIIYGRSDATINRHGIRMGTSELYRAVETHPEVLDSLVVDLEYLGRPSCLLLFVQLRDGLPLDEALQLRLKTSIKKALSARHVPDEIHQVEAIPRTLSGKKMELPIKKLLLGAAAEQVMKRDAMANAEAVAWYQRFAEGRT